MKLWPVARQAGGIVTHRVQLQRQGHVLLAVLGPIRLVVLGRPPSRGFGPLLANLANALEVARSANADLYLVRSRRVASTAVFELRDSTVNVLPRWSLRGLLCQGIAGIGLRAAIAEELLLEVLDSAVPPLAPLRRLFEFAKRARAKRNRTKVPVYQLHGHADFRLLEIARGREEYARVKRRRDAAYWGIDFTAASIDRPVSVSLRAKVAELAEKQARELGIGPEQRVAVLHVREHSKPTAGRSSALRDAEIANYLPAIDALVAAGYTVVRFGDSRMPPLDRPGVVDLAAAVGTSSALNFWVFGIARLFIATDSGPYQFIRLRDVPCLATNLTSFIGRYGTRSNERFTPQLLVDARTGGLVPLREVFTVAGIHRYEDAVRSACSDWELRPNSAEDLRDAVLDMLPICRGVSPTDTVAQRVLHEQRRRVLMDAGELKRNTRNPEAARPSTRLGRVAPSFADKYF